MLSKEGDTIKIIMKVEITSVSKRGINVMLPSKHVVWIDNKDIDNGKVQIEE